MTDHHFSAPLEFKLASGGGPEGVFSGYGAIYGNVDSHGDVIRPGAFSESLAERKTRGARPIPMHVMHRVMGGDGLPVGVWTNVQDDGRGLKVEGKISGMNTDAGRLIFERIKDGALGGLSIGYKVKPNGATYGSKAGDPKRTLTNLHLTEISLVDDPSNALTRVDEIKARDDEQTIAAAIRELNFYLDNFSLSLKAGTRRDPSTDELFKALDRSHLQLNRAVGELFR